VKKRGHYVLCHLGRIKNVAPTAGVIVAKVTFRQPVGTSEGDCPFWWKPGYHTCARSFGVAEAAERLPRLDQKA